MVPTSAASLLITLLFVVPGFVYQAVRISVRGRLPLDVDLPTRLIRAIVSSGIFALVYLLIFGRLFVDAAHQKGAVFEHPRLGAAFALLCGIVAPSVLAILPTLNWQWLPFREKMEKLTERATRITRYDPTPTAWDKTFQSISDCFIRILNQEGRWIAGYYGADSYATSFPEGHQIFLERAHQVAADGTIGDPIDGSRGVLVDCSNIQLLQVVAADQREEDSS